MQFQYTGVSEFVMGKSCRYKNTGPGVYKDGRHIFDRFLVRPCIRPIHFKIIPNKQ